MGKLADVAAHCGREAAKVLGSGLLETARSGQINRHLTNEPAGPRAERQHPIGQKDRRFDAGRIRPAGAEATHQGREQY